MAKKFTVKFLEGRKCIFCGSYGLYRLADKRVKCKSCRRVYSIKRLRRDLDILYHFYLEVSANKAATELDLSYNTVHNRYMFFREKIAEYLDSNFRKLSGELEIDESYFGGKRKGKRGHGALNKVVVFGILERNGKVYTTVVPDVSAETLMAEIKAKTEKGSVFYTDDFKSYKSLKHYGKHSKIKKTKAYAIGRTHINGIEGFWSFAKERFYKYHGIHKANYYLYLKEMEFRFNHRNFDIFKKMFEIIYR
ncbi:MAG: IS1595 family transposase [Candidatus Altiarchaeota archaeon]|nr:IS1595 family transposase [Candidatus Altiarchaeota archaeon]